MKIEFMKYIEAKIAQSKEYEYHAGKAKDYPTALRYVGAIIAFEQFLKEMEGKGRK